MKISLLSSVIVIGALTLVSSSFGQKKNETTAAVIYKNQYMMNMAKGKLDEAKLALIEAKSFIDLAAAHPETKNSQKTLYYKGEIYANFLTLGMQSQDTTFIKKAGEDAMDQSIGAFKLGYPLGKKYKVDIKDAANQKVVMLSKYAGMLFGMEQYEEAAELYEYQAKYSDAIERLDTSAIFNTALCYDKAGIYDKAAINYEKVALVNYRGTNSAILASSAYRKIKNLEKAKEIINNARKSNPSDKGLLLELVNTNIDAGDAAGAEKALADAISTDPDNKQLHYTIGTINIDLKENEKAEASLNRALEIDPNYADAQYQLGAHLVTWAGKINTDAKQLKFGDANYDVMIAKSTATYERAVIPLEKYIANFPKDKAVLNILFQIHRNLGNSEKAIDYKKRAEAL
ncbi:MAG: tetratricopeptide repeat protein [Flavobacteriales bacterium]|nr:tetratricopeptide repeat protein [Flavobacteriales bacterium]